MLWSSARLHAQKAAVAAPSPAHSRLAASSIRQLVANNDLHSAFIVLNSLRLSCLRDENAKLPGVARGFRKRGALKLGQSVSPRLAYHTLLHTLIRSGLHQKAYKLAEQMLPEHNLRTKSYEALVQSLLPSPHNPILPSKYTREDIVEMEKLYRKEFATEFKHTSSDPGTRLALFLLFNHHVVPSTKIVDAVLIACLDQGNAVVATLIVTKLLQHFPPPTECIVPTKQAYKRKRAHAIHDTVTPYLIRRILHVIDTMLSSDIHTRRGDIIRQHAAQALANLATLLKDRKLPFLNVSTIVRSVGRCPRLDKKVWVRSSDGTVNSVKVYGYLHDILREFCSNPTSRIPSGETMHVGLNTYNSLLHYALFSRRSLPLGDRIITHMTRTRNPPLEPSTVTQNILVRGATILQRNDIAINALSSMRFETGKGPLTPHQMILQRKVPYYIAANCLLIHPLAGVVDIAQKRISYSEGLYSNRIPNRIRPRLAQQIHKRQLSEPTRFSNSNILWLTGNLHRLHASWQKEFPDKRKNSHILFNSGHNGGVISLPAFWLEMLMLFVRYRQMERNNISKVRDIEQEKEVKQLGSPIIQIQKSL